MPSLRATTATLGVTALLAVPLTAVLAAPAHAVEREARCDGAKIQLEVEREDGGRYEVDADVDNAPAGSRWRVVLRQNGTEYVDVRRTANREGDVSIDRDRRNTRGSDVFTMRVNRVGTSGGCDLRVVVR